MTNYIEVLLSSEIIEKLAHDHFFVRQAIVERKDY